MQKEIKVDRPEPDVPEITIGDLVEGTGSGNIMLVLDEDDFHYKVVVISSRTSSAPKRPTKIHQNVVKPFIGTVTITQRP